MRKQSSHREHKTNKKREEHRTHAGEELKEETGAKDQKGKAEVVPPRREEKLAKGQKPSLQVSMQASVDIPRGNIVERLPGISIQPHEDHGISKEERNLVFQVIHRSTDEGSSDGEVDGYGDDDGDSDNGGKAGETNGCSGTHRTDGISNGNQTVVVDKEQPPPSPQPPRSLSSSSPHPPPQLSPSKPDLNSPTRNEGDNHSHSQHTEHQELESQKHNSDGKINGDGNNTNHNATRRNESEQNTVGRRNRGSGEDRALLPGYMPEVVWEEVAIGRQQQQEDLDEEGIRQRVQEAEERLLQHDLRQRILDK